ncbi:MAG: hypothetical protein SAL07_00995 [Oscillatoria sp. PMC 1051.18]|uniref:hypothetical protein n=1 Tax=Oscillatoria salina TaxID=331517 RepID=UPI0013B9979D|nr:hypothetical protein [Oscillatoria salina]MBZ8179655.1 hypothetical protein [Oscillatoria salina IIICB1]MEC4895893.1 hypothetical protein [Oscillatoria sp. PMC 1050.18]MEC5028461.1 hypothetical protein [Oscillatoria sp. PMC 1051.18]NET89252.1 hypothetical protein [Kamptonema sp. SIO1D9]
MTLYSCPCCGNNRTLRHARSNAIYWFCPHCRQEVIPHYITLKKRQVSLGTKKPVLQPVGS